MCNNIIVLYIFIFIKIISFIILPIIIFIKRKKDYSKLLCLIDIFLLVLLLICNFFAINKCVYNSNMEGISRVNNENKIIFYNEMHPDINNNSSFGIKAEKKYKTYTGRDLYYYNQNSDYMNKSYYMCDSNKIYMNSVGNSITSFSTAISTLLNKDINPVKLFDYYRNDNYDMCNSEITLEKVYNSTMKRYGSITLTQINKYQVESSIKNDGIVIAKLKANSKSKLTCDSSYILIYSVDLDGKFMISDSTLKDTPYVCPYSSKAYGNVISNENMVNSWSLEEIDSEVVKYYLVKRV